MRLPVRSIRIIFVPLIMLFPASSSLAQPITNPDSLSKKTFGWNQEEKEFGFAHFDQVFKTRDVARGNKVRKPPQGVNNAAFSKGGSDLFIGISRIY